MPTQSDKALFCASSKFGSVVRRVAAAGGLTLPHGTVEMPVFMPVGTAASVKALEQRVLEEGTRDSRKTSYKADWKDFKCCD
jgi:hypothetical protein